MRIQVFIIELPFEKDDPPEGSRIHQALAQEGISCALRTVKGKPEFLGAFEAAQNYLCSNKHLIPILHISAHGNPRAIGVPTWQVAWEEMIEGLVKTNKAVKGRLILCMSSCEGLRGWKMNLFDESPAFSVLVGSEEKITWEQSIAGFTAFYRRLSKGKNVRQAVHAMKCKSSCPSFMTVPGKKVRRIREEVERAGAMGFAELNSVRQRYGLAPLVATT